MLCCLFNQLFFSFPLWYYHALKLFTWHHMVTLAILYVLGGLLSPLRSPSLINCTSGFHPFWVGKRGFVLFFRSLNNEKFNEAPIGRSVKNLFAWLVGIKSPNFPSELAGESASKMKLATISQTQGVGGSVSQQRGNFGLMMTILCAGNLLSLRRKLSCTQK